jgi:hypothetical protein
MLAECLSHRRRARFKPTLDELKLLGLPADATEVTLSVEHLETLARDCVDTSFRYRFWWEAFDTGCGGEAYRNTMRLADICEAIGADRVELVTADIARGWLENWEENVAESRKTYRKICEHGEEPSSNEARLGRADGEPRS